MAESSRNTTLPVMNVTSTRRSRGRFKSICSEAGPTPWARRRRSRHAPKNISTMPLIKNPGTTM